MSDKPEDKKKQNVLRKFHGKLRAWNNKLKGPVGEYGVSWGEILGEELGKAGKGITKGARKTSKYIGKMPGKLRDGMREARDSLETGRKDLLNKMEDLPGEIRKDLDFARKYRAEKGAPEPDEVDIYDKIVEAEIKLKNFKTTVEKKLGIKPKKENTHTDKTKLKQAKITQPIKEFVMTKEDHAKVEAAGETMKDKLQPLELYQIGDIASGRTADPRVFTEKEQAQIAKSMENKLAQIKDKFYQAQLEPTPKKKTTDKIKEAVKAVRKRRMKRKQKSRLGR